MGEAMDVVARRGPPPPATMRDLKIDERGYIVPFFVLWEAGRPKFEAFDQRKYAACVKHDLCWLCGHKLNPRRAFVLGPMCVVNRVTSEPPCHVPCAEYALRVCPFLTRPLAKRQPMPEDAVTSGNHIERNPGAMVLWVCRKKDYQYVRHSDGGVLVHLNEDPVGLRAWSRGEECDWQVVSDSLYSGMPILQGMCQTEEDLEALRVMELEAVKLIARAEHGGL